MEVVDGTVTFTKVLTHLDPGINILTSSPDGTHDVGVLGSSACNRGRKGAPSTVGISRLGIGELNDSRRIGTVQDVADQLALLVGARESAISRQWNMTAFDEHVLRSKIVHCNCELLHVVQVLDIYRFATSFSKEQIRFRYVGSQDRSQGQEFAAECLDSLFGQKLRTTR